MDGGMKAYCVYGYETPQDEAVLVFDVSRNKARMRAIKYCNFDWEYVETKAYRVKCCDRFAASTSNQVQVLESNDALPADAGPFYTDFDL